MKVSIIFILFVLISINLVSSEFGFDNENLPKVERDPPAVITFKNDTGSVNKSDWWDGFDTTNTTQIENNGGVLNILVSWLNSFLIPYTGADKNIDLGTNNFTIDTNLLFVDSSGFEIGIGTITPSELLDVDGNVRVNRLILDRGVQSPYIEKGVVQTKGISFFTVGSAKLTILEGGNVGIGTTSPTEKLEVVGNLHVDTSAGNFTIRSSGVDSVILTAGVNLILSGTEIEFEDSEGEIMRLTGGKFGINTTTPQNLLNVLGDGNFTGSLYVGEILVDDWLYNQTTPAVNTILGFNYYNLTDFDINDYYLKSNPFSFWNDTFATFNKTFADTLYADISVVSNPFDQSLNTTDNVTFNSANVTGNIYSNSYQVISYQRTVNIKNVTMTAVI